MFNQLNVVNKKLLVKLTQVGLTIEMSPLKRARDRLNCSTFVILFSDCSSHSSLSLPFTASRFHRNVCDILFLFLFFLPIRSLELRDWLNFVSENEPTHRMKCFEITFGCKLRPHANRTHCTCSVTSVILALEKITPNSVFLKSKLN